MMRGRIQNALAAILILLAECAAISYGAHLGCWPDPTVQPTDSPEPTPVLTITPGPAEGWRDDWRIIAGRWDTEEEAVAWAEVNLAGMDWEQGHFFEPDWANDVEAGE